MVLARDVTFKEDKKSTEKNKEKNYLYLDIQSNTKEQTKNRDRGKNPQRKGTKA